jgi:carbonic anhydrase
MKLRRMIWVVVSATVAGTAFAGEGAHWGYEGEHGPENWADLSPDFVLCGEGVNQSPIAIGETVKAGLLPLRIDYRGHTTRITNNGHTLQVDVESGSFLEVEGGRFELKQFHFHSPSEHSIRGESFPLEAHFVHRDADGQFAVIGVMFRLGSEHAGLMSLGKAAPPYAGGAKAVRLDLESIAIKLDPEAYYRYSGSLTTPPCSEGLRWFVLKGHGEMTAAQRESFIGLIGEDARGIQPHNARIVVER